MRCGHWKGFVNGLCIECGAPKPLQFQFQFDPQARHLVRGSCLIDEIGDGLKVLRADLRIFVQGTKIDKDKLIKRLTEEVSIR